MKSSFFKTEQNSATHESASPLSENPEAAQSQPTIVLRPMQLSGLYYAQTLSPAVHEENRVSTDFSGYKSTADGREQKVTFSEKRVSTRTDAEESDLSEDLNRMALQK